MRKIFFVIFLLMTILWRISSCYSNPPYNLTWWKIELHLDFKGDLEKADTKHHDKAVMCFVNSKTDVVSALDNFDPFLCTHIIYESYNSNYSLDLSSPSQILDYHWMAKFAFGKLHNPKLKIILVFPLKEEIELIGIEFFNAIDQFLRINKFDGLYLGVEDIQNILARRKNFICDLKKHLELEALIFLGGNISVPIKLINPCIDYFILNAKSTQPQNKKVFSTVGELVLNGVDASKIIIPISPYFGVFFQEHYNDNNGENGAPQTTQLVTSFIELDKQIEFSGEYVEGIEKLYALLLGSDWTLFRNHPGQEVFMTDEERWVSFEDLETVDAKAKFVEEYNLAGIAILNIANDNPEGLQLPGQRQGEGGFSFPFTRQTNSYFSNHNAAGGSKSLKQVDSDGDVICPLVAKLKNDDISPEEFEIWICVARLEDEFNRYMEAVADPGFNIGGKCPHTKKAVFGFYRTICAFHKGEGGSCKNYICKQECKDFIDDDISKSLTCLSEAARTVVKKLYPSSWSHCSNSTRENSDVRKCSEASKHPVTSIMVSTAVFLVVIIFGPMMVKLGRRYFRC